MKPDKILYVDDEAMALKYFERLVSPLAPVITANSVEEGRAQLQAHGAEIAVLVCDQRMPGERGNELLRHAREHHPHIVRMLTTAYSELGDAIEAINAGEIYRYIHKPWELDNLRTDLKNALELSTLRFERDELMHDKLLAQQSQLRANRLAMLYAVASTLQPDGAAPALHRFAHTALAAGTTDPKVDWHRWEHADLLQAEAQRAAAIAAHLRHWLDHFAASQAAESPLQVLASACAGTVQGDGVLLPGPFEPSALLTAAAGEVPGREACAWLAWLLWHAGRARVEVQADGYRVHLSPEAPPLPAEWLADAMERLGRAG